MLKHSVVLKFNNVEMLKTMLKVLKTQANRSSPESNGKVTAALRWKLRRVARNSGHSMKTVLKLSAEPKYAKQRAKDYADRHPGMYSLERVEKVAMYFTQKER